MTRSSRRSFFAAALLSFASPGMLRAAPFSVGQATEAMNLLAADRAYSAGCAGLSPSAALGTMFAPSVLMVKGGGFVVGRAAAIAALSGDDTGEASLSWQPAGGGISADARHGFTYGVMTLARAGAAPVRRKYLSYWAKTEEGWQVLLFKRSAPIDAAAPAEPTLLPPYRAAGRGTVSSLVAAEAAFSARAGEVGIEQAFGEFGSAGAINLGGGDDFTRGPAAISREVGKGASGLKLAWAADDAIVSGSADLGVTWGWIRDVTTPSAAPARFPFFTIWRREGDRWRYVAE